MNENLSRNSGRSRNRLWAMRAAALALAAMFLQDVHAQNATNAAQPAPIETPAAAPVATNVAPAPSLAPAATNAPATTTKAGKKKRAEKKAEKKAPRRAVAELRTEPLVAGPAEVIASNVNIRGQAKLRSEVIGKLNKTQQVTVLEEITLSKSAPDEPSAWAKILLPPGIHVWVNSSFLDANKAVKPRKLNVRSGPGENYSVLGTLKRGDVVKDVSTKGDWTEIDPPADAYAFVAAQYLKQLPPAATVAEAVPVAPPPTETPTNAVAAPPETVTNTPPTNTTETAAAAEPEPPPKRIVQREGMVRGTFSIQAPTHFELVSPETGKVINYLYTPSVNLDLRRYKGLRVVVTGEEGLDERWKNTPMITIQRLEVVE